MLNILSPSRFNGWKTVISNTVNTLKNRTSWTSLIAFKEQTNTSNFLPQWSTFLTRVTIRKKNIRLNYKILYHEDLEKRGGCGVLAHERHESHASQ